MSSRAVGFVVAATWLLSAGLAGAAERRPVVAALDWQRDASAEGCLEATALVGEVEARLKRPVFGPRERADVVVKLRWSRRSDGAFVASIELRSGDGQLVGTRELAAPAEHCSALDESVQLAIALMVDITADELPEPAPRTVPPPPPPRTPIQLPPKTPAPRQPWHFQAAALATAALGLLPAAAGGVRLSLGIDPPTFWTTEIDFTFWPSRSDPDVSAGARFRLATFGLYLCPIRGGSARTRGWLCVGQEVGQLEVTGFGFDRNEERHRLSYDLGLRARFSQRVAGPIGLMAGLQALFPLSRDEFVAREADTAHREVFQRPIVAGGAELGLQVEF